MIEALAARVRAYIETGRARRGDAALGCVRLDLKSGFVGIVYEKPGGSSAQFEAAYDPERGFVMLSPSGEMEAERDPESAYQRFVAVIEAIPEQRRAAIEQKLAEWRSEGCDGARLRARVVSFNITYEGTRGGQLSPEELRLAARLAAS